MNTCKTCKWWGELWEFTIARPCLQATGSDIGDVESNGFCAMGACDSYGDDVQPEVMTGPDFGCVLHEPKDQA